MYKIVRQNNVVIAMMLLSLSKKHRIRLNETHGSTEK